MKSNIFKKAHELTKNIIKKGDNYRATFRLCLSFVYSQIKKGVDKMVELKGTEKQVKWGKDIRKEMLNLLEKGFNATLKVNEKKEKDSTKTIARYERIKSEIENVEDSKFFIENFSYLTQNDYVYGNAQDVKMFCNNNEIFKGMSNFMQRLQNEVRGK